VFDRLDGEHFWALQFGVGEFGLLELTRTGKVAHATMLLSICTITGIFGAPPHDLLR
jgi:hypothetical protein